MIRIQSVLRVFAITLAAGIVAEGYLRASQGAIVEEELPVLTRIKAQAGIRHAPYAPDPDLGAVMAPSQEFRVVTPDYTYVLRTDHAGFPNRDPWPARADVVVLGNSLITGAGVGYEGQFTTLLQKELDGISVLNLGVHGGGTGHELRAYRKFAATLKPKFVIATLWLTWEIDNSLKFVDWLDDNPRPDFTDYRLSYNETHAIEERVKPPPTGQIRGALRDLVNSSRLLRTARQRIKSLRGIREPVERVVLENGDVLYLSTRDEARLMSGWHRPGTADIRKIFFEPLEQLRAEVEANGGRFLVVLFPSKEELYAAREFPELLTVVHEARAELAARQMPVLDLYPVFEELGAARPAFFRSDMHLNAYGHRIVADALAQKIR